MNFEPFICISFATANSLIISFLKYCLNFKMNQCPCSMGVLDSCYHRGSVLKERMENVTQKAEDTLE